MKFKLGQTVDEPSQSRPQHELDKMLRHDLVRKGDVVQIADRRNDGNVIISQLHLAFMLFHNKAIDVLKDPNLSNAELFKKARALVTLHYQYCIMHDYLKQLVPDETLGSQLDFREPNAVPFEFTTAAFRFGHSMISPTYDYNRFFSPGGLERGFATLKNLFSFTSQRGMNGLGGALPTHWVIDWERFFRPSQTQGSRAEPIDLTLPENMAGLNDLATLEKMAKGLASIAHRNLKRGYHRFMPSGQDVALALHLTKLNDQQIIGAFTHLEAGDILKETGFHIDTPLWVYFLCEAKIAGGNKLGPAAGAIIRGTITSLIKQSRLSASSPGPSSWTPHSSPLLLAGEKPILDIKGFLQFAGVLS
jgi:hypothetical protein